KDGASLAVQRRGPRGMRRRRDRYLLRRDDLMEMLRAGGLMPPDEAERKSLETLDPYALRAEALHGPLTPHELGRPLFHLNERRAHRALPCAQEFRMVQEANNLRILVAGEPARCLTRGERDKVLNVLRSRKEMQLDALWKLLKLPTGTPVNLLDQNRKSLKGD